MQHIKTLTVHFKPNRLPLHEICFSYAFLTLKPGADAVKGSRTCNSSGLWSVEYDLKVSSFCHYSRRNLVSLEPEVAMFGCGAGEDVLIGSD